ncbi:MAG: hypothetical protein IKW74_02555, partial [Thermoguttaceae bacterium]|nr:hypothetical protein [Thermoguttaceae bacterium]
MDDFDFANLSRRRFFSEMGAISLVSFSATSLLADPVRAEESTPADSASPPNPAIKFPGAWAFDLPKAGIILISDTQLEALQDPDREVNLSLSADPSITTLRRICEDAQRRGAKTLIIAFDEFWLQYRSDLPAAKPRELYPDSEQYIE